MNKYSIAFSNDSTLLAATQDPNEILIIDTHTKKTVQRHTHTSDITHIAFTKDNHIVIGDTTGQTIIFNATFDIQQFFQTQSVRTLTISPQMDWIAVVSDQIHMFSIPDSKPMYTVKGTYNAIACSSDGAWFAFGGSSCSLIVYHNHNKKCEFNQAHIVTSVGFSKTGYVLAAGNDRGTSNIYDINTLTKLHTFEQREQITNIVFYNSNVFGVSTIINILASPLILKKGHIIFYDVKEKKMIGEQEYDHWVTNIDISTKGHVAFSDQTGDIYLYTIKN